MDTQTALVFGVTGQDGSYLSELLLEKGYNVVGVKRRASTDNNERLTTVKDHDCFLLVEGDITDPSSVINLIKDHSPSEIYNLAAQSHVGTSFSQPSYTFDVNACGVLNILEGIRTTDRVETTRFYQASTSEMFGNNYSESSMPRYSMIDGETHRISETKVGGRYQDENTPLMPDSPYAVAKVAAHNLVGNYRRAYGLHGSCGILFNHESERRGEKFVTRKITKWIAEFSTWVDRHNISYDDLVFDTDEIYIPGRTSKGQGFQFPKLRLGNLQAMRDWGHAKDYVYAMWLMLQQEEPDDYVIATGESRNIGQFLDVAFAHISIDDWKPFVVVDPKFYRPSDVEFLQGKPDKANTVLDWTPEISFNKLVEGMVKSDVQCCSGYEREAKLEL